MFEMFEMFEIWKVKNRSEKTTLYIVKLSWELIMGKKKISSALKSYWLEIKPWPEVKYEWLEIKPWPEVKYDWLEIKPWPEVKYDWLEKLCWWKMTLEKDSQWAVDGQKWATMGPVG